MPETISLCLITKNEKNNIRQCLKSVKDTVDEMIVVDTGSTDNTAALARDMGAQVYSFLWNDNFSDARNFSLEVARGDWILVLDADEELAEESRHVLKKLIQQDAVEGYFVKIVNYVGNEGWGETCADIVFRLFRNRPGYRFRGAIHEQIADVILEQNGQAIFRFAEDLVIHHHGYLDSHIADKDKKNRNLTMIERELKHNSANQVLLYHYGVELFRAERYQEAADVLAKAAKDINPGTIYFPKLLRYMVMSHQSAGQLHQGLKAVELGLQYFPNYADLYYYGGVICLELKCYFKAEEYFLRAISQPDQPTHYASFYGLKGFRAYYQLGRIKETFLDFENALNYYLESLRDNPYFSHALESIVSILNPRKNPQDTQESLETVFDFTEIQAKLLIGQIYFRQGAYQLALECFEAVTGKHASPEYEMIVIVCLIQQRRYLEAMRRMTNIPRHCSSYPFLLLNKMFCYWLQDKKKKIKHLLAELRAMNLAADTEKILSLFEEDPHLAVNKRPLKVGNDGLLLLTDMIKRLLYLGEKKRALWLLSRLSPTSLCPSVAEIAGLFCDFGYPGEAMDLLKSSPQVGKNPEACYLLGEIYERNGNWCEAEQCYRLALQHSHDSPQIYMKLLQLYQNRWTQLLQEAQTRFPGEAALNKLAGEDTRRHE